MKLCIPPVALAVIARARFAVLPGWVAPLPVLIPAAGQDGCAAFTAWVICQARRKARPPGRPA